MALQQQQQRGLGGCQRSHFPHGQNCGHLGRQVSLFFGGGAFSCDVVCVCVCICVYMYIWMYLRSSCCAVIDDFFSFPLTGNHHIITFSFLLFILFYGAYQCYYFHPIPPTPPWHRKTSDLIPLCHPLMLHSVNLTITLDRPTQSAIIRCYCHIAHQTGTFWNSASAMTMTIPAPRHSFDPHSMLLPYDAAQWQPSCLLPMFSGFTSVFTTFLLQTNGNNTTPTWPAHYYYSRHHNLLITTTTTTTHYFFRCGNGSLDGCYSGSSHDLWHVQIRESWNCDTRY